MQIPPGAKKIFRAIWGSILVLLIAVNGYPQRPEDNPLGLNGRDPPSLKISLDFRDAEIEVVARFISEITGVNFVLGKSIKGRVTLFVPGEVTPGQAYQLFESILKLNGFTTIPGELSTVIVTNAEAVTMGLEVRLSEVGD